MSFQGEMGVFDGCQQAYMAKDLLQFNKINEILEAAAPAKIIFKRRLERILSAPPLPTS